MAKLNRSSQISRYQQTSTAIKKFLANVSSLPIAGEDMTPAEIAAEFDGLAASAQAVQTATVGRTAAIQGYRDKQAQLAPFVTGFTSVVQGLFAQSPDTLAAFGLVPRKKPAKSVATKAGALLKTKATRKARGTMGKSQKAQITGTLTPSDVAAIAVLAPGEQGPAAGAPAASPVVTAPAPVPTPATSGATATAAAPQVTKS